MLLPSPSAASVRRAPPCLSHLNLERLRVDLLGHVRGTIPGLKFMELEVERKIILGDKLSAAAVRAKRHGFV